MIETLLSLDGGFLLWVQEFVRQAWLDPIVSFYTKLGDAGLMWIALCVLLLIFPKTRRAGLGGAMALILSLLCTNVILKNLFTRTRPWLVVEGLTALVAEHDPNSFPSGHTSAAFAFAAAVYRELPLSWTRFAVVGAAICMGWSRIYVAVHYPSDVIAGAVVGTLCGLCAAWLYRKFLRERFPLDGSRAKGRSV